MSAWKCEMCGESEWKHQLGACGDWWCGECRLYLADQDCSMTADRQHVSCPRCGQPVTDVAAEGETGALYKGDRK